MQLNSAFLIFPTVLALSMMSCTQTYILPQAYVVVTAPDEATRTTVDVAVRKFSASLGFNRIDQPNREEALRRAGVSEAEIAKQPTKEWYMPATDRTYGMHFALIKERSGCRIVQFNERSPQWTAASRQALADLVKAIEVAVGRKRATVHTFSTEEASYSDAVNLCEANAYSSASRQPPNNSFEPTREE